MIRTQILLTPTLYETLKMKAEMEGKSLSSLVREALEKLLKPKKRSGKEVFARMKKYMFSSKNAPKDLSTNDDYLYHLP